MLQNPRIRASLALGLIVLAAIFWYLFRPSGGVPGAAQTKFHELSDKYKDSAGASVESCTKGDERVYIVTGSGGYIAESHYYDATGNLMGSLDTTDEALPGEELQTPPVRIHDFTCTVTSKSATN